MSPGIYLIRRLLAILPTFLGITLVGFFITHLAPGGPVEQQLQAMRFQGGAEGSTASSTLGQAGVTEEVKEALKKQFGFDQPIHWRYWLWLQKIMTLDLGESLILDEGVKVLDLIIEKFPVSLRFGIFSFLITYLVCIPLGIAKALKDGSRFDFWTSFVVFAGYAMPSILLAVLLIVLFGGGSYWNIFPISGLRSDHWESLTWHQKIGDEFMHMVLPMTCFVMGNFATLTLLMKNSFLEEIQKEYVLTARAKGLKTSIVYWKHVLRNALIPVATGFASILGVFLSGSLLIEQIFGLDGIGRLGYSAIVARDYPVVLGLLVLGSGVLLFSKILTDLIYMWIDPRISFEKVVQAPSTAVTWRGGARWRAWRESWHQTGRALLAAGPGVIRFLRGHWSLHPTTLQRWRRFRQRKLAWFSFLLITGLFGLSLIAELWLNDDPLALKYAGRWYFPVIERYSPSDFGLKNTFVVDYRELTAQDAQVEWVLFAYPYGPLSIHQELSPPSRQHWLGTDQIGRDLLARLVYGFRISMIYSLSVWVLGFLLGTILGGVQGFFGGRLDFVLQRFTEIWSSMPTLYLLIILIAIFGQSLWLLVFLTVIFEWVGISYYIRAEFLKLRQRAFVQAAVAYGSSTWRLMFKHILPNGLTPIITFTPFTIASGITGIAILDYLGLGLPPPTPSWGELMKQALDNFTIAWWIPMSIISAMLVTMLALVFINEGVREAFDPKSR